jgi:cytochrome c oxidase subunit 4
MSERIMAPTTYYAVFMGLVLLTVLTVWISFAELGSFHLVAGLIIGTCKAALVALFFMHVLYSSRLTWAVILGALLWLAILMTFTLSDYLTRGWMAY